VWRWFLYLWDSLCWRVWGVMRAVRCSDLVAACVAAQGEGAGAAVEATAMQQEPTMRTEVGTPLFHTLIALTCFHERQDLMCSCRSTLLITT
jgi:hypothetical protein